MKSLRILLMIAAAGSVGQAFEFTPPVSHRRWEIQPAVAYVAARGIYDQSGDFEGYPAGTSITTTRGALRAKYGFWPGWNVECAVSYAWSKIEVEWLSFSAEGFEQPEIALKWMDESGVGLGASAVLPLGSGEIVGADPFTGFEIGGLLSKDGERWSVDGGVGYLMSLEKDGHQPGGTIIATLKPRYKLVRRLALSMESQFAKRFDGENHGVSTGSAGHILVLAPGLGYGRSNEESLDFSVPISLMGKNARAIWGLTLQLYWQFGV